MEALSGPGANEGNTLPASDRDGTERRLLRDEQGSSASRSPRGSTSKTGIVRLSSSPSRGARWGQCVYDPDGSEVLVRDGNFAFYEERKMHPGIIFSVEAIRMYVQLSRWRVGIETGKSCWDNRTGLILFRKRVT